MEGKEVPPPKDWVDLDDDDTTNTTSGKTDKKDVGKDGTIGGTAGQH